ncbi:hypothetical protein SSX86_011286 [Deinandra increscens subsp. villosa]|uniref:RNA-directed DNA polymerase, eukaryota n=1 Tax=Deinandra increscens subsp. villosa TaxID=3103831 RepID=A0AAP0DDV4_9ASTR
MSQNGQSIMMKKVWGRSMFQSEWVDSTGRSGGLISSWDSSIFSLQSVFKHRNVLVVSGWLIKEQVQINIANVYAPQDLRIKRGLWELLVNLRNELQGWWVLAGDFNEVRRPEERLNSEFNVRSTAIFNEFIRRAGVEEYSMGGHKFTCYAGGGKKFSKLDHVLVCENFMNKWPDATLIAMPRFLSDHSPVLLRTSVEDFGPVPFRFFSGWLAYPELENIVIEAANQVEEEVSSDYRLALKLKSVKGAIKAWQLRKREEENEEFKREMATCNNLEREAEVRTLCPEEMENWVESKSKILAINKRRIEDLKQKSRVRWAAEGDDNTAFFHGMINANLANNRIGGIYVDGRWIKKPKDLISSVELLQQSLQGTEREQTLYVFRGD